MQEKRHTNLFFNRRKRSRPLQNPLSGRGLAGLCVLVGFRIVAESAAVASTDATGYPNDIWRNQTFRRQFMGTYAVKAAVEPTLAEYERDLMKDVLTRMAEGDLNAVLELIRTRAPLAKAEFEAEKRRQEELAKQAALDEQQAGNDGEKKDEREEIDTSLYGFVKRRIERRHNQNSEAEEGQAAAETAQEGVEDEPAAAATADDVDENQQATEKDDDGAPAGPAQTDVELTPSDDYSAMFDYIAGNVYFQKGDLDQAVEWYDKAIEKFPSYLRAHKNLGIVQARKGHHDQTRASLTRAVELGENSPLIYGLLGYAYAGSDQHLSAESAFRLAILLEPDNADWKRGLIRSLFGQESYAEAVAMSSRLIAENPDNPMLWRLQANAYLGMHKPMDAAQNYEYLRMRGQADQKDLRSLGDIYLREQMMPAAVDAYIDALNANEDGPINPFTAKAKMLAQQGALEEAKRLLGELNALPKARRTEDDALELLRLEARIAMQQGATEEQARILQDILERNPTDGQALIDMGQYHANRGQVEMAIFHFQRAEGLEQWEAVATIRHAQVLVQEGQYKEAIPLLERAIKLEYREQVAEYLEQVKAAAKTVN